MSPGRRSGPILDFGHRRPTRRELIAAALGLGAVLPARAEDAPAKVSQLAAAYRGAPNGMFSCAACTFFIRPRSCKVVSGDISPTGWCKLFDLPD
jgi:hypothetical protein